MVHVRYSSEADKDLEKFDKGLRVRIIKRIHWLSKKIEHVNSKNRFLLSVGEKIVLYQ